MKKILAALLFSLAVGAFVFPAYAAEPPVAVSHKLIRFEKGAKVSIEYALHIVNTSGKPLSDLTLRVFRSPCFFPIKEPLAVGSLAAGQSVDIPLAIDGPPVVTKKRLLRQPLLLGGRCLDAEGNVLEFPAKSRPGGAP